MVDKRYSLAEVVSFLTEEDPCPEFSESSDSEAMGECCEGLDGSHEVFLFQEKDKIFIYFCGQFTVTYVIDRLFCVY